MSGRTLVTLGIDKPATQQVMAGFATHGGVVTVDFRGHGRSTGRSSVGRDETLDLDAAVRSAREFGYSSVAVVGFSLGAAVESMAEITLPCLLVHGTKDEYFGPAHAQTLRRASSGAADLWIEHGMGHGETGTSAALVDRMATWTTTVIA